MRDYMTTLAFQFPVKPQPIKKSKDWTHVLASDGSPHFSPALARSYMNNNGLKGKLSFVYPK